MTVRTTMDAGTAQSTKPGGAETPRTVASEAGFNPLHPSVELPPEQLIRLLGLETNKIRNGSKSRRRRMKQGNSTATSAAKTPQASPAFSDQSPDRNYASGVDPGQPYTAPQPVKSRFTVFGVPVLILLGIAVTAYVLLSTPSGNEQLNGAVSDPNQPRTTLASGASRSVNAQATATASARASYREPQRSIAIATELQRLRKDAEQRLARQLSAIAVQRELTEAGTDAEARETLATPSSITGPSVDPATNDASGAANLDPQAGNAAHSTPHPPTLAEESSISIADDPGPGEVQHALTDLRDADQPVEGTANQSETDHDGAAVSAEEQLDPS